MENIKRIFIYLWKNWENIILCILLLDFLERRFWIIWDVFIISNYLFSLKFFKETNITDWMQAIWWIASAIITYFVFIITKKFSIFTKQQNDIALEEFRPIIIPDRDNWNLLLKNKWVNDAVNLDYFISTSSIDWKIIKINKIGENLIIPPNWNKNIEIHNWWYHSIIYKYKNSISWVYYLWWFNWYDGNNFLAIGESNWNYQSPLKKEDFQKIYDLVSVKNQIINSIDFEKKFINYLKNLWYIED